MHYMGELVLHRTQVEALAAGADVPGLSQAMQDLTRASQALQAMVMQVRMIPVEAVFLRFPRLVRDLQTKLGKDVELRLVGKDTELDRTVVDALGDPLVHLVRNSLDHGLEPPEERVAAGKPATGVLEISARHAGGNVVITVSDDGRGIDPERVARKAAERGLIAEDAVASVDSARAAELLFHPGFSTAEVTSDISGRGVGMDAVRSSIRELGGEVLLSSEPGAGTTAQIRLPLTLAIMAALLVEVGGRPFAIPLDRDRAHRAPRRPPRALGGRQPDARHGRRRAPARRRLRAPQRRSRAGSDARRRRPRRLLPLRAHRRPARRPARARHPPAAARHRRGRPDRRGRALRRPDRADRRLRRHHPEPGRTTVSIEYTELQLDALRELANIGSGKASTALSMLLDRSVDISVPTARALSFADAVEATGDYEQEITGIVLGIVGDLEGVVLLLVTPDDADTVCRILGVEPGSEYAPSALGEVGNIVGSSYINALAEMTGMAIEPTPPATATDMLGAIVQSVLASQAHAGDVALMLDSELAVEGSDCSIAFMLVPSEDGVGELLGRLGLG